MSLNQGYVHSKFKLNGIAYTKVQLSEVAYDLVKEGEAFEKAIGNFLLDWLDRKLTLTVKTSGSTGNPKPICIQKQQMINSALATGEFFHLSEGQSVLLCLSADYIAGKMMLVRALVLGLALDYVSPSSKPLAGLSKRYDFVAMVPLQVENSLNDLSPIQQLIVGGAPMSIRLQQQLQNLDCSVYETYGMTETITHIAVRRIPQAQIHAKNPFKALSGVSFSLDDRNCLVISAPKVASEVVVTNDLVNLISKTEFEWLGRFDNVINSGGIKLFPEQLEKKLALLLTNRFFVAGIPDEKLGQQLVLIVEGTIDEEQLLREIKKSSYLERFEIPKKVFSLSKFKETETGKIRRNENLRLIGI